MTTSLKPFWQACEKLATAGVMKEWQKEIRDPVMFAAAMKLLRPLDQPADYYPCTNEHWCSCSHQVIRHTDGDIVAICTCEDGDCDAIEVTEKDLTLYQLDFQKLFGLLATNGGFEVVPTPEVDLKRPVHFGNLDVSGMNVPIYFEFENRSQQAIVALMEVMAGSSDPVILMRISHLDMRFSDPRSRFAQTRMCVAIRDLMDVQEDGKIVVSEDLRQTLDGFRRNAQSLLRVERVRRALSDSVFLPTNDYHTIRLHLNTLPVLTDTQADVVRVLHRAQIEGVVDMSHAEIFCKIAEMHADDSQYEPPEKMGKVFRAPDERCRLITSSRRGYYRLNI